jgi:carbamoyl-phosphate synthase large subunit
MNDPILQRFITDPEYTIDLFTDFSANIISVVPRKRIHVFGGESFIGVTRKNAFLINECIRLGNALRLIGHTTIQCFFDEKTIKLIEVNPRYGGGASLGFAAGAFTPRYLIRLVLGKEVLPVIGEFKDNFMMLRYTEDIFVDAEEVCHIE